MPKKYFDFIEKKDLSKNEIASIERERQTKLRSHSNKIRKKSISKLKEEVPLKHVYGRVIISIDLEGKNSHTFSNGQKIYIGRQFNNLNRRETEPVNAYVVSGEGINKGAEILIHPNAIHDSNKIFGYGEDETDVRYYSIPQEQCYLWRNEDYEWMPFPGYVTGLRVFKEYKGTLVGIDHELIPNVLYITSGEYANKVVRTLKACDYEIIFMGADGKEERVIRCRHFENEIHEREEIIAVDEVLTNQIIGKDLLVGISSSDAKSIIFTV